MGQGHLDIVRIAADFSLNAFFNPMRSNLQIEAAFSEDASLYLLPVLRQTVVPVPVLQLAEPGPEVLPLPPLLRLHGGDLARHRLGHAEHLLPLPVAWWRLGSESHLGQS